MVSQHTRSSTLLPGARNSRSSQNVSPIVKIRFKVVPHEIPRTKTTDRSSGQGKLRSSICCSNTSRSSTSTIPGPPNTSSSSEKFEQDAARRHQDPSSSRVLSTARIKSPIAATECAEQREGSSKISEYATLVKSVKSTKFEDVKTSKSTNPIVEASQFKDIETSEYDPAEVLGYGHEEGVSNGLEYAVARSRRTQEQLWRSSVAWFVNLAALDDADRGSVCGSEDKVAHEQALSDVLDLILSLIPTKE